MDSFAVRNVRTSRRQSRREGWIYHYHYTIQCSDQSGLAAFEITGCLDLASIDRTFDNGTLDEGIAGHSSGAGARGYVIVHGAQCVSTARAWAGIRALVADARAIMSAIGVHYTLGPATHVRIALVLGQAHANSIVASRVRSARIQVAGIDNRRRRWKRMHVGACGSEHRESLKYQVSSSITRDISL